MAGRATSRGTGALGVGTSGQAIGKAAISGASKSTSAGASPRKSSARPVAGAVNEAKARGRKSSVAASTGPIGAEEIAAAAGALLGIGAEIEVEGEAGRGKSALKSVVLQPMSSFGKQLAMRPRGREVQQQIDSLLRSLPPESVLVIDFDGVEMMDYSFADEALGAIFSRLSAKEYPNRYIVLAAGEGDLAEALIENVEVALARREVAALVLPKEGIGESYVEASASSKKSGAMPVVLKADAGEWRVAGTLPQHLIETLRAVMDKQQVTVRELADELHIDSATACNNRIARLYQLRLVRREAAIVPEGGRQYFYSSII